MVKNCIICNKEFIRYGKQAVIAKTCSFECMGLLNRADNNTECTQCKKMFHLKESAKRRYKRSQGYFCSTDCIANFRAQAYIGDRNPNFRIQVTTDQGYKLDYIPKFGRIKLHHKIVFEVLDIDNFRLPVGFNVHHRDCNVENNTPENLVLLSSSDHRWIHKQFGNATLWAYTHNKISLDELLQWTNDIQRAKILLPLNILEQKASGVFKLGELLEKPEVVNQQPS